MIDEKYNEEEMRLYLLGRVPEHIRAQIELRLLDDPDFRTQLEVAEADLMEDYLEGTLNAEDRRQFDTLFLEVPRRRRDIVLMRGLKTYDTHSFSKARTQIHEQAPSP